MCMSTPHKTVTVQTFMLQLVLRELTLQYMVWLTV
jgi:hypothetical protein